MYKNIIYSIILHGLIIAITYFGLPRLFYSKSQESIIAIDLVPVKEISNLPDKTTVQVQKNKPDEAKTIVKTSGDIPETKVKKIQEQPKTQKPPSLPNEKAEAIVAKKEPEKPQKNEPQKQEKTQEDLKQLQKNKESNKKNSEEDAWLKSIEDRADTKTAKATKNSTSSPEKEISNKKSKSNNFDPTKALSISERDNIKTQIEDMWLYPAGAKDSDSMTVLLKIIIEKDGTVISIKHLGGNDAGNQIVYQVVIESAINAVMRASPLKNLNTNTYHVWHEIEMNFDIRDLMNKQ